MTRRTVQTLGVSVLFAALLGAACARVSGGNGGDDPSPQGIDHPTGADQIILEIDSCCGFTPIEYQLKVMPSFALLGDGRIVVQGAQIEIYPGPALPALASRTVTEEGIQAILEAAREAGLFGPDHHYDTMNVTDAPTTTFTLVADGERHVISAYALDMTYDDASMPKNERTARAALVEFNQKLGDLASWLPDGALGEEAMYEIPGLRVFVTGEPRMEPDVPQAPMDWPLDEALEEFGDPVENHSTIRCGAVTEDGLAMLLPKAREANELTPWSSGGQAFGLVLRPMLPHESGCPATLF